MKKILENQLCALAALSVPRHAACSMCASDTCTVLFMSVYARENMEVQV